MKKYIFPVVIALLVGFAVGYVVFNKANIVRGVSSDGVTNSTSKIATITLSPATASATTTSLYNGDGTDRVITSSMVSCTSVGTSKTYLTGAALASFTLQMSTSTSATGNAMSNTNYAANLTISTSSPWTYTSSSTDPVLGSMSRIWPTNTYLNPTFNATNTAVCTLGVHYLSL